MLQVTGYYHHHTTTITTPPRIYQFIYHDINKIGFRFKISGQINIILSRPSCTRFDHVMLWPRVLHGVGRSSAVGNCCIINKLHNVLLMCRDLVPRNNLQILPAIVRGRVREIMRVSRSSRGDLTDVLDISPKPDINQIICVTQFLLHDVTW